LIVFLKAKNILKKYQINDIEIVEIDNREDTEQIQDYLNVITGARTVNSAIFGKRAIHINYLVLFIGSPRIHWR
jgi:hypothetical protein